MSFEASLLERLIDLARQGRRPVIGLNGPVGAGKSTLARRLAQQAAAQGVHLAVASIDDAYLTWEARLEALKGNPFGVDRVPPGSHEPGLLVEAIDAWRSASQGPSASEGPCASNGSSDGSSTLAGSSNCPGQGGSLGPEASGSLLRLPRFDKRLRQGAGDRWGFSQEPADGLLLEGWLIGCRSLSPKAIQALCQWDGEVNHRQVGSIGWDPPLAPATPDISTPIPTESADLQGPMPCDGAIPRGTGLSPGLHPTLGPAPIRPAPIKPASIRGVVPTLSAEEWNWLPFWDQALQAYEPLWERLDGLWLLWPRDWQLPRRWRFQAEARQRRLGGGWLPATKLGWLVRSSLASLPPELYLTPLLRAADQVQVLDRRRRCLWQGPGRDFDPNQDFPRLFEGASIPGHDQVRDKPNP